MKYRGVSYLGKTPNVWRWTVTVGQPQMLRIGDAATEHQAEVGVREVITRSKCKRPLRSLDLKRQM